MNHTILIRPNGTFESKQWLEGRPDAHWLHQQVEGYIEAVPYWNTFVEASEALPCIAYCNEEGKLQKRTINEVATRAWDGALKRVRGEDGKPWFPGGIEDLADVLVGNVILVIGDDWFRGQVDDDDEPLP